MKSYHREVAIGDLPKEIARLERKVLTILDPDPELNAAHIILIRQAIKWHQKKLDYVTELRKAARLT